MEIKGVRINLRDFNESDFDFYNKLEQNYLTYRYENTQPDECEIINNFSSIMTDFFKVPRKRYKLLICQKHDNAPIGNVSIKLNWEEIREWEIGWALHPEYWGMGYATEAAKLLIDYAFRQLNAHRIVAYANADNTLSENVMKNAGMIKDGLLRETKYCDNKWCNELVYSILEKDWNKSKGSFK